MLNTGNGLIWVELGSAVVLG